MGESMDPHAETPVCKHFQKAAELVGKRWVPQVVHAMRQGPRRFSDLREGISSISDNVLSQRLKELELEGIVTRTVTPSTPVCITYGLTDRGEDLAGVMSELQSWAERWAAAESQPA
jgi:DNA-binding HxlR family transcriptional regulator